MLRWEFSLGILPKFGLPYSENLKNSIHSFILGSLVFFHFYVNNKMGNISINEIYYKAY